MIIKKPLKILKEDELEKTTLKRSKLTETDAEIIGHKIKAEISKRFK